MKIMKGGVLEVLLVSAEGMRDSTFIGTSGYYAVVQCGNQERTSKITKGEDKKAYWNEKFTFELPLFEWETTSYLKFKIMDEDTLSPDDFVGETRVHLGGLISEGNEKGNVELKPASYNVVLEDDTYKGEIKIGLKFVHDVDVVTDEENRECVNYEKKKSPWSFYRMIFDCWRIQRRWNFLFLCKGSSNQIDTNKQA